MTRRIKRIAATITAGILLVCVSFVSFAEDETLGEYTAEAAETKEEAIETETADAAEAAAEEKTEAINEENTEETDETAETEENSEIPEETVSDDSGINEEPAEEATEAPAEENAAETEEKAGDYCEFTENDDTEHKELSDDAGYIDEAVTKQYISEVTEELITVSEEYTGTAEEAGENQEAENTEEAEEENQKTAAIRMWITDEAGEILIGGTLKLKANSEKELNDSITWEIRNELWEKDVWQQAGEGKELELVITEENAGNLVRFVTADGAVSETYGIRANEKTEEETVSMDEAEAADEPETVTGETAETEEAESDEEENDEAVTEEAQEEDNQTEETAEEPAEETVIRAWITAEDNTLTANAESELTGVSTWQTWDEENEKWQKIGYGDQITVEELNGLYRFVMQDGTVSEEFGMTPAEEETMEVAAEEAAEELPELPALPELPEVPELPEDRSVTVVMTCDDAQPGFGSVIHFAAELKGYDGLEYTLQWITSTDNENWTDVEGATGEAMDVTVTKDNFQNYWRVKVTIAGAREVQE